MRVKNLHKEQQIRRSAIEMIVALGFDGFSMHKLAKHVNISVSTIYVYFTTKEELLTQLFAQTQITFEQDALHQFNPTDPFEKGLWQQWTNRLRNIQNDPIAFRFHEQFRTSPLVQQESSRPSAFREAMNAFFDRATKMKQIKQLDREIAWAVAFGPFYTLVNFHLANSTMAGAPFILSETKLRTAFELVLTALQPSP